MCACACEMNKSVEWCTRLLAIYKAGVGLKAELISSRGCVCMCARVRAIGNILFAHRCIATIAMNKRDQSSILFDFAVRLLYATLFFVR